MGRPPLCACDLNRKEQAHYNARASGRVPWPLPWKILLIQAAATAAASLVLLNFDSALGTSVLLGGVVMLVPGAWFVRQITRGQTDASQGQEGPDSANGLIQSEQALTGLALAKAHLWQAGVRFLATILLMGIVISGYEALNPTGFFGCLVGLVLVHIAVAGFQQPARSDREQLGGGSKGLDA